jgi:RNA polymerase sigma factor (sigma-70 family)
MPHDDPSLRSSDLLNRLTTGDEKAAEEIFERYVERLTHLVHSRLAAKLAARVDPEDIVMSAYRSFFVAARDGRYGFSRGGDLWRLLVEITLHKLYHAADRHLADRRSVDREQCALDASPAILPIISREPTPDEALAAADELTAILRQLGDRDRQALELRLQGYELEEIAERLKCNERTVRRAINEARRLMAARGGRDFVPSAARRRPSAVPAANREHLAPAIDDLDAPLNWSDFVLQEQIGAGATGKVYRARNRKGGNDVAIKFLRKTLVGNATVMRRFLLESRTVAALRHPAIVAVHGAGRTPGGGLFLVMDLVRGFDLDQLCRKQAVTVNQAIQWVREAALAVDFAHHNRVIHCDLKPSNLLLDHDGRICVTDFGMAVHLSDSASLDTLWAGTPAFMAPEQVDPRWATP